MTVSFQTTEQASVSIAGGLHPADLTARPQVLEYKDNTGYHDLISTFAARNATGALLNTSFNMHGKPIVGTPVEALETLMQTDLDGVLINDMFIERQE